jgi:glycosyltransferase involved in cell wall biosynthesis
MPRPGSARRPQVVQWAQERGEVGGVMAAHQQLTALLRAEGCDVRYVDTGSASRALRSLPALRRRSLHIFHITRLWRSTVMAPLFALLPGRTLLVLHSGSTDRQLAAQSAPRAALTRLGLRAFDEIWAVSGSIRDPLPPGLQRRVTVVRFPVAPMPSPDPSARRDPHALSVATNAGQWYYHADLAVEAVRRVREEWPDARLRILAYGDDGADMARLREQVAGLDWVELSFDAGADEVASVLARSGVFLRPTSWDGDSLIVREALEAGARVVASDTCPRAAGVELAALDAAATAQAVLRGGRTSDGAGLAEQTMEEAARAALGRL